MINNNSLYSLTLNNNIVKKDAYLVKIDDYVAKNIAINSLLVCIKLPTEILFP